MNIQDNNPYPNSNPSPSQENPPNPVDDKGSILSGFFIGWGLMIGCGMLTGFFIAIVNEIYSSVGSYDNFIFRIFALVIVVLPIIIIVSAMIWFGKKGKSKTVKGIAASIGSLIALALLLVAACFGMLAMH